MHHFKMNQIQNMGQGPLDFGALNSSPHQQFHGQIDTHQNEDQHFQNQSSRPRNAFLKALSPELNPLEKREVVAQTERQSKRAEIRKERRQEAAAATINIFYCNCRGINSLQKQEILTQHVANEMDIIMLSETKLTKKWNLNQGFTMQTQRRRNGGCLIASNKIQAKAIKGLNTSIAWATMKVAKRLIHTITCYVEPSNSRKRDLFLQQLSSILQSMKFRDPEARVIISGDFNDARPQVDSITKQAGLEPVIDSQIPTHNKGGCLDQVYTNLEVVHKELRRIDPKFTDHSGIFARLRVGGWRHPPPATQDTTQGQVASIGQIAKEACKQSTIDKLLLRQCIIGEETMEVFRESLRPRQNNRRWYQTIKTERKGYAEPEKLPHAAERLSRQDWQEVIAKLEGLHKIGDSKQFFKLTKTITKIEQGGHPIKGLIEGETEIFDREIIDKTLANHFRQLYSGQTELEDHDMGINIPLFCKEDVLNAIRNTNFEKSIGPDGFNGKILNLCSTLKERFATEIVESLNSRQIPTYLKKGRLVALSKVQGKEVVDIEQIRPIIIRSHISKIMEQATLEKVKSSHSYLLATSKSQTGFKRGMSTHQNIYEILQLLHPGRGRKERRALLFIDLQKAYDTVSRKKLREILTSRCKSEEDRHLVALMMQFVDRSAIQIGAEIILTEVGLPQGSVLAPLLFNVYLEEALKSQPRLWYKYKNGFLLAYADDMVARIMSQGDALTTIEDLTRLKVDWNLRLNPQKCEILGLGEEGTIGGIKLVKKAKYLGVAVTQDSNEQRTLVNAQITRNLAAIKGKLWISNLEVKECVLNAFLRSLMLYLTTPMRAAGLWSKKDIKSIESKLYRSIHGIPRDISNEQMMNILQHTRPVAELIEKKARDLIQLSSRQENLAGIVQNEIKNESMQSTPQTRNKGPIYLPKVIAHTMLALARGRTIMFFNNRHRCCRHNCIIDDQHIRECEEFINLPDLSNWINKLRESCLRDWEQSERDAAILTFGLLKLRLEELLNSGMIKEVTIMRATPASADKNTTEKAMLKTDSHSPEKKKRGRPPKHFEKDKGQMKINQFFIRE